MCGLREDLRFIQASQFFVINYKLTIILQDLFWLHKTRPPKLPCM